MYGAFSGSGEAFTDSYQRHEDLFKERSGKETYENTVADLKDIATAIPVLASTVWNSMWKQNTFDATKEIGEDIGEDAILGMRWTAENSDKAFKAYPVSTVMMLFQAGKIAGTAGRLGKATKAFDSLEPVVNKVNSIMDTEVADIGLPDAIKRERKLVDTEKVPGTLYTRAIGDEGLKLKDLVKPALYTAGTGALVGAGELGAVLGLSGPYLTGVMAKRSSLNKNIVGKVGQVLRHTSAQSRFSDEVAIRSLFQHAPQAAAALDTAALQVSDAIKAGADFSDKLIADIAESSGLNQLTDVQPAYTFRDADGRLVKDVAAGGQMTIEQRRSIARGKLDKRTVDALNNVRDLVNEASGEGVAAFTITALDDLMSGDSVQYAKDAGVMAGVMNEIKRRDPSLSTAKLRQVQDLIDKVSNGPVYGNRSLNPRIKVGDTTVDIRSLVTNEWKKLDTKKRGEVAASTALSLIENNKAIMRSKAAARALDRESMRIFRTDDQRGAVVRDLLNSESMVERAEGQNIYMDALLEKVFLDGDTVPMVSPQGLSFNRLAESMSERYLNNPQRFQDFLQERLGRDGGIGGADLASAQARLLEVVNELSDTANVDKDIGKMGTELSRSIVADGLEDNRLLQNMRALEADGLITKEDLAVIERDGLSAAFGVNLQTRQDGRSIRAPLASTYGWLERSVNNNMRFPSIARVGAHLKAAYTIYNPASHVNNAVSNMGLISLDRNIDPITALVQTYGSAKNMSDWRAGKKFSERDSKIFDKISKMGFAEGDLITAEIQSLGNFSAGYGSSAPVVTSLDLMKRFGGTTAKKVRQMASNTYRLGDVVFKQDEAIRSMNRVVDAVEALEDGQYVDIPTSKAAVRRIRKENGKIITPGKGDMYDVAAAHGRMRANDLFFDYSQRPGALRYLDQLGGATSFVNPYLTWYWKALGIGGDGLFKRVNNLDLEFNTNNPSVLAAQLRKQVGNFARRSVIINGMRSEYEKNPEELQRAMSFMPSEGKQILFTDMADPNVMSFRDISSMNFLDPFSTVQELIGTTLARIEGSDRSKMLDATGEQKVTSKVLELIGVSGSPAYQTFQRFKEGRNTVEDALSPLIGVGLAQTALAADRLVGASRLFGISSSSMSSFDKLMQLDESIRPKAMDYYFRRITSIGWNKDFLFGKAGNRPGKLTRYMTTLKRNLKNNLVKPKIEDARAGAADSADIQEALILANEMYERRLQQLFDATSKVYPNFRFPEGVVKPISLRKTDL